MTSPGEAAALVDPRLLQKCISFLLPQIPELDVPSKPLIVGLNGLQGAGKTTLGSALCHVLSTSHSLSVLVVSIDDFYLARSDQANLAASFPNNMLLQFRGEPGTHDIDLLAKVLNAVVEGRETKIPRYDKSAFGGLGDRLPAKQWDFVNRTGDRKVQVLLLEGWCVGFRPLRVHDIETKWKGESRTLKQHTFEDLLLVNEKLEGYEPVTAKFDAFIHLDAEELEWVYEWRLQQEHALIAAKGSGMSDTQVETFVDGYYPAYELYYDGVRQGVIQGKSEKQLRVIVGKDRKMTQSVEI
ncbi:hypothetical protein MKZ38_000365 [Zalerion maritima]|uniref:Uncharacterized protein n=1 Tax=Zalerion maritima TaxID=339359 RepID=A0AAD5RZJ0_9PEZI|nr:hypothetical protein MKZ38_000365 [Zalerion maritima]